MQVVVQEEVDLEHQTPLAELVVVEIQEQQELQILVVEEVEAAFHLLALLVVLAL
jgi:hypothetical protein